MGDGILDLLIIGGSAAGAAAAIYSIRAELNIKVISKDWGGEVARSGDIFNYPGFTQTHGIALAEEFKKQVEFNKASIESGIKITSIQKQSDGSFIVSGTKGTEPVSYQAKVVLITTGVHPRELEVSGEAELKNKGVSYCTTCDGPLFRNKAVAVVGGGNSAAESVLFLSKIATSVYLLNINEQMKAEAVYIDQIKQDPKIMVIPKAQTTKILGTDRVSGLEYRDLMTAETKQLEVQGIFVHIGFIPNSDFVQGVEKNQFGEIIVDKFGATNIPGLYAAGDVTDVAFKQIVIAAGQGATAALSAINYLYQTTESAMPSNS